MWGGFTPSHIVSPSSNSFDIIIPCSWKRMRRVFFVCVSTVRWCHPLLYKEQKCPSTQSPNPQLQAQAIHNPSSCIPEHRHVFWFSQICVESAFQAFWTHLWHFTQLIFTWTLQKPHVWSFLSFLFLHFMCWLRFISPKMLFITWLQLQIEAMWFFFCEGCDIQNPSASSGLVPDVPQILRHISPKFSLMLLKSLGKASTPTESRWDYWRNRLQRANWRPFS